MSKTLPARVTIPSDVLFSEVDDEVVLLHMQDGLYFALDDIGTRIWNLLSECEDVAQTVERMLSEYDVDQETLKQDMANLIADLADVGLLTIDAN